MCVAGSLAFGQNIVAKLGTPMPTAAPAVPAAVTAEAADVRTAGYITPPPTGTVAATAAPLVAPNPSVSIVFAWAYSPNAAGAPSAIAAAAAATEAAPVAVPAAEPVAASWVDAFSDPACSNWTGFYVGLNTGGAVGSGSAHESANYTSPTLGNNDLISGSGHDAPANWIFGGQVGYDRQVSAFVVGVEADWERTSQRDTLAASTPPGALAFFGAGANGFGYSLSDEHRLTNIGTVRLRSGIAVGNSLLYATGGLAWGTAKETLSYRGSANPLIFPAALQPGPFLPGETSFSQTKVGYAVGGGIETKLSAHWSIKAEYVFVGLGRVGHSMPIGINPAFGAAFAKGAAATATSSWLADDNLVRVGLNYRF
jgi:outer membrane immunogenic protein